MKSLKGSGKDFVHRESSECSRAGEVCGEQLPQSCAHPSYPGENRMVELGSQGERCVGKILLSLEE